MPDVNISSAVSEDKCCGCGACARVCPVNCIEMEYDNFGFMHPLVDETKCIKCGKCLKVCQILYPPVCKSISSYSAACSISSKTIENAASGGVCSEFARSVIRDGGIYYGVASTAEGICLCRIRTEKEIRLAQGSKYIQANIIDSFETILNDVRTYIVLVCGTPCICAAIIKYIEVNRGNLDNLISVSFPCGGWSSPQMFEEEVISRIGNRSYDFWVQRKRHAYYSQFFKEEKPITDSGYFSMLNISFWNKVSIRDSCVNCQYCRKERIGDLIVGDWWCKPSSGNRSHMFSEKMLKDGVSILGTLTEKGKKLIDSTRARIVVDTLNWDEFAHGNERLITSWKNSSSFHPIKRFMFKRVYLVLGLKWATFVSSPVLTVSTWMKSRIKKRLFH